MSLLRCALVFALLLCAQHAFAQDVAAPPMTTTEPPGDSEQDAAALRAIENKLATGAALSDQERALPASLATRAQDARVRALAVAVCAWLEPAAVMTALVAATGDEDARVRTTALASVVSLARRFEDAERKQALAAALLALDDKSDEVACAAVEAVQVLAPSATAEEVRARAESASNQRYACFARAGGLPPRPLDAPPLPSDAPDAALDDGAAPDAPPAPAPAEPAPKEQDGSWLSIVVGAAAGAVIGGSIPSGFVPSRDVLTYRPDRTRLVHEEISFGAQALGALAGGALGGAALFGLAQLSPPTIDDAASAALASGAGMLLGGSLVLMLGLEDSVAVWAFTGASAGGLSTGAVLAAFGDLSGVDHALALSLAAGGALAGGLSAFAAVPEGLGVVGGAERASFGFGVAGVSAAALGVTGLVLGMLVDVPAHKSAAAFASGAAAAGLVGAVAFVAIPNGVDGKSRIACGSALAAQLLGSVAGALLLPDSMFGDAPSSPTALHIDLSEPTTPRVRAGMPTLVPLPVDGDVVVSAALFSGAF